MEQVRVGKAIYVREDSTQPWEKKVIPLGGHPKRGGTLESIRAAKRANRGNMTPNVDSFKQLPKQEVL